MTLRAVEAGNPRPARRLAFVRAVARQRAAAPRMVGTTRKPCIAPRLGPNVLLAGVPRLKPKLHRPRPGGVLSRAGHSLRKPREWQITQPPRSRKAVEFWTSPYGPARTLRAVWTAHGQRGDTLPTACPHSRASRPQLHRFDNETLRSGEGAAADTISELDRHPRRFNNGSIRQKGGDF